MAYLIPNGTIVQSTRLQIDKEQARKFPNDPQVRVLEFDISKGHLQTILGRSDLEIAVSCHLASEPPQICQWADEILEIRLNDRVLPINRRVLTDGAIAHKVSLFKDLCNINGNKLEVILSPTSRSSQTNLSLSDFLFSVVMIHMPSIRLTLEASTRPDRPEHILLSKRLDDFYASPKSRSTFAEIPVMCPVFKTRIKIPARLNTCQHLGVFDLRTFLQQEALWPTMVCPICQVPMDTKGFIVDSELQEHFFARVPERFNAIIILKDGSWRPVISEAPVTKLGEFTPLWGPYTNSFAYYLEHGALLPKNIPPLLTNGILDSSRHSLFPIEQLPQQRAHDNHLSDSSKPEFQSTTQLSNNSGYATAQPVNTETAPYQKERVLSTTQTPTNSLPDILNIPVEGAHANPKSLSSSPAFPNNSPTGGKDLKRSFDSNFGEKGTQNSCENPPKLSRLAIAQRLRQLDDDPETVTALRDLPDLSLLSRPDVLGVIYSLTKPVKQN
ncbi:unnamed protein product [Rodentolepis nana]|uniref:SP-RING-type domain-containing protein n=1 Tax=Rodentolepis nana TaxID=102285 RepID=A0A3P7S0X7_RODNA|nr:unnamed protein product [Rodentolepis nana]